MPSYPLGPLAERTCFFQVPGYTAGMFPELLVQDFNWQKWSQQIPEALREPPPSASRLERIRWGLGTGASLTRCLWWAY